MWKVQRQSPNTKSIHESGWMGGEAALVRGVWWELCEEVTEGWGIAIEIMMVALLRVTTSSTRGTHAYLNVLNKLVSNSGAGDAWNNIGNYQTTLPPFQTAVG